MRSALFGRTGFGELDRGRHESLDRAEDDHPLALLGLGVDIGVDGLDIRLRVDGLAQVAADLATNGALSRRAA